MASTAVTRRAYPKRMRAEVSYYESSSDEGEVDDEYPVSDDGLGATTRKRLKASRTTSTKSLPKRKIFPFTSLPAELKNQIYALALTDPHGMFLVLKTKHYRRTVRRSLPNPNQSGDDRKSFAWPYSPGGTPQTPNISSPSSEISSATVVPVCSPNILLLSRAIYAETQPILYAGNTFALEDTMAMHAFLATIGPKNRATLTNLTIKAWGYSRGHKALNHPAFTMLAGAVNLTHLHLDCKIAWGGPRKVARQLYRDGFHWLEAVGAAKGKFDAAIELLEISESNLSRFVSVRENDLSPNDWVEQFDAELRKLLREK